MATNFLNFCRISSAIDVAFMVGVLGVDCVAREDRIYTGSGLFWGWEWTFGALPLLPSHYFPH